MIDSNTTVTVGLVITLLSLTVMFGRWQGKLDVKLDNILESFKSIKDDIDKLFEEVNKLHTRVTVLENKRTTRSRKPKGDLGE